MTVFARVLDDHLANLLKQIDEQVAGNRAKQLSAFMVLLTDDPKAAEHRVKQWAAKHKIKRVPLTVFDGAAGPKDYQISKEARLVVMMWVDLRVKVNRAFANTKLDAATQKAVLAATRRILR